VGWVRRHHRRAGAGRDDMRSRKSCFALQAKANQAAIIDHVTCDVITSRTCRRRRRFNRLPGHVTACSDCSPFVVRRHARLLEGIPVCSATRHRTLIIPGSHCPHTNHGEQLMNSNRSSRWIFTGRQRSLQLCSAKTGAIATVVVSVCRSVRSSLPVGLYSVKTTLYKRLYFQD